MYQEEHTAVDALADDLGRINQTNPSRQRRKKKRLDTFAISMVAILLCLIGIGGFIVMASRGPEDDGTSLDDQPTLPSVEYDFAVVSKIRAPVLMAYEQLTSEDIPEIFEARYDPIRRKIEQAEADTQAGRFHEAYDLYEELDTLIAPLATDLVKWRTDERLKTEATTLLAQVTQRLEQVEATDADRWAARDWQRAETARQEAERLFAIGQFKEASEQLAQAEPLYLTAQNKIQSGQAAIAARQALNQAMAASGSEQSLREYANNEIEAMFRLRSEADSKFNTQDYAQAKQLYQDAQDALHDAHRMVDLGQHKRFYAFHAGFHASGLMLVVARGDSIDVSSQKELAKAFEHLDIAPNPAANISAGDDGDYAAVSQSLTEHAHQAIVRRHDETIQACYQIGFHANVIDEALQTKALTGEQKKRIHQSLGTMQQQAKKAGWSVKTLRPMVTQIRVANQKAKLKDRPEATRTAWDRLLRQLQSKSSAAPLMDASLVDDSPRLFRSSRP